MLASLLEALFPRRCAGCGRAGWPFCRDCAPRIAFLAPPGCRRCGRPLEYDTGRCLDCPPPPVTWARSPFLYEGPIRAALIRLKFSGLRSVADALVLEMARCLAAGAPAGPAPPAPGATVLTWVPLGRGRLRRRGYDQAEVLARALGRAAGLPVRPLVRRVVETSPQARRAGPQRREALRGAFVPVIGPPPAVVLVDDVLTSGATAAECARVLRDAGAVQVGVLTAARALNGPVPARCYTRAGLQPGSVVAREMFSR